MKLSNPAQINFNKITITVNKVLKITEEQIKYKTQRLRVKKLAKIS